MLKIEKRTAHFGANVNVRTEKHGDKDVIGCDVVVRVQVPAARELVNTLIGEGADAFLWRDTGHGILEPRYPNIRPAQLDEKIESARIEIWPRGLDDDSVLLPAANLKSVRVKPLPGAVIELSFTLQSNPDGEDYAALIDCLNRDVEIAIECKDFGAQKQLPLEAAA